MSTSSQRDGLESILHKIKNAREDFREEYLGTTKLLGYTGLYNMLGTYHPSTIDNFSNSMLGAISRIPVVMTELLLYIPKVAYSVAHNLFADNKISTFNLNYLHNSDVAGFGLQSALHLLGANEASTQQITQWMSNNHINPENFVAGVAMIGIAALWNQKIYRYACPVHKHGLVNLKNSAEGTNYNGRKS